jgi:hypothetical protein
LNAKVDFSTDCFLSDEGKVERCKGSLMSNRGVTNLDYKRRTASTYFNFKLNLINLILFLVVEPLNITGNTDATCRI